MRPIEEHFKNCCAVASDINEHLKTLFIYASECDHITEFGFRSGISTSAFLAAEPKKVITYDIKPACQDAWERLNAMIDGKTEFVFKVADSRTIKIETTDLLFIDTLHTYEQLKKELKHADRVRKYIILHDTDQYGSTGEHGGKGLTLAIAEFLKHTHKWEVAAHYPNNNGLTILSRK